MTRCELQLFISCQLLVSKKKSLKFHWKSNLTRFLETFCIEKAIVNIIVDLKNLQKSANNVESSFNKDTQIKAITKLLGANATISRVTGLKVNYFEKQPPAQQSEYLEDKRQKSNMYRPLYRQWSYAYAYSCRNTSSY